MSCCCRTSAARRGRRGKGWLGSPWNRSSGCCAATARPPPSTRWPSDEAPEIKRWSTESECTAGRRANRSAGRRQHELFDSRQGFLELRQRSPEREPGVAPEPRRPAAAPFARVHVEE